MEMDFEAPFDRAEEVKEKVELQARMEPALHEDLSPSKFKGLLDLLKDLISG